MTQKIEDGRVFLNGFLLPVLMRYSLIELHNNTINFTLR